MDFRRTNYYMRIYILIILLLVSLIGSGQKSFVSASPHPLNVNQPDGSSLIIYGVGDEFNHFSVTEDKTIFAAGGAGGQSIHIHRPNNFVIVSTCSAFTISTDRSNSGCEYGTWKFLAERSLIVSETTITSSETTSNSSSSSANFTLVLSIPIILSLQRIIRKKNQI